MKYLTNSGLSYFLNKIKAYIASQLNSKASVIHTHTKSDITDLPNGYVVDSTLDGTSSNAISNSAVVDALDGKSNAGHTHTKSEITDFPTLATVATSGSYNDLTNKPTAMTPKSHTHGNITNAGAIGTTANKPLITTTNGVITTGSFGTTANTFCQGNDSRLSDARAPTAHTHSASDITSGLATVATSGSYNDLDDRPTIPTVNNATLKIQKNGTDIKTFTANASSNVTCNITVPTKTSDLTNDSGFLTSHQSLSNYSTLANTIKSLSISGKTITYTKGDDTTGTLTTQDTNTTYSNFVKSGSGAKAGLVPAPSKTAGTTKYLREDGTWQVPPDHTYTVNNATLTIQKNGTNVATFTSNASSNVTANISVPTKVSELSNDSGFLTSADLLPIGSYIQFAGSQAPDGFLVCNGGEISRTTYSALFAVIGTTYGSGDGSTTFNLPNLIDRFLQGSSTSGTVKNAGLPNITGGTELHYRYHTWNAIGAFSAEGGGGGVVRENNEDTGCSQTQFNASWSNPIYGNSSTVQPPALTCLICIKY